MTGSCESSTLKLASWFQCTDNIDLKVAVQGVCGASREQLAYRTDRTPGSDVVDEAHDVDTVAPLAAAPPAIPLSDPPGGIARQPRQHRHRGRRAGQMLGDLRRVGRDARRLRRIVDADDEHVLSAHRLRRGRLVIGNIPLAISIRRSTASIILKYCVD